MTSLHPCHESDLGPTHLSASILKLSRIFKLISAQSNGQVAQNLPANAGDAGDTGSILGPGRSLVGGNGNPLQYSCLENSMGKESWRVAAHGVSWGHKELDMTE